ncbi:MAG: DUF2807 domain-containing protein [Acidobacteria bacterium]|nr:DUF2807 domain-containing protein [Acidobacteriota bacterium]
MSFQNATVNLYGDGKAEVNARKLLKAKVKGSGSVDYYGDPEEISIDTSKGGAVNKVSFIFLMSFQFYLSSNIEMTFLF